MSAPQDERNTTRTPSLRQRALNASARNSTIDAARAPSVSEQPNEKTAAFEQCNELESQTSNKDPSVKDEKEDLAEVPKDQKTEATPERLGEKIARVRASTWWLLGALILAIPLSIFATTYSATTIDGIRVTGLFVWLEIFWTSGWLIYFFVWFVGKAWNVLCRLGFDKWDDILLDTAWSQRGFFLALVTYGSSWVMCDFSTGTCDAYWLHILQKVLLAAVPALGIFLIKDLLLEVIMIRQSMRMVEGKQELVLRQFEAFRIMFSGDESEETFRHKVSLWCQQFWLGLQGKNGGIFLRKRTPTTDDFDSMLSRYCEGEGKDEDFVRNGKAFVDAIRDTCRTNYIEMFTDEDSGEVMQNFEESFFQYILDQPHKDSFLLNGRPLTAKEMLKMMDRDGNGCVNIEEWVEANAENIMAFRDINKSITGIKSAAKAVNAVISCLLMCVVAIIYGKPLRLCLSWNVRTDEISGILHQESDILPYTHLDNCHRTFLRTQWHCYRIHHRLLVRLLEAAVRHRRPRRHRREGSDRRRNLPLIHRIPPPFRWRCRTDCPPKGQRCMDHESIAFKKPVGQRSRDNTRQYRHSLPSRPR
jgi:hypothetical protein